LCNTNFQIQTIDGKIAYWSQETGNSRFVRRKTGNDADASDEEHQVVFEPEAVSLEQCDQGLIFRTFFPGKNSGKIPRKIFPQKNIGENVIF
jgi:hypothetical protein